MRDDLSMSREELLSHWAASVARELSAELGVEVDGAVDQQLLLDVAREAAHAVDRPAAPITTYLLGIALARSTDPQAAARASAVIGRLAAQWDAGLQA